MSEVTWGDMTAGEQRFMTEAFEFGNVTCIAGFQHDAAIALEKRGFFAKGDNWGVYKITPLGRMFMDTQRATEAPPADAPAVGIPDVQCACGYMASQHWADGSCPGDGYLGQAAPSAFAQAAQGDDTLAVALYELSVLDAEMGASYDRGYEAGLLDGYTGVDADWVARFEAENKRLREALELICKLDDDYRNGEGKVGINFTLATAFKAAREALKR